MDKQLRGEIEKLRFFTQQMTAWLSILTSVSPPTKGEISLKDPNGLSYSGDCGTPPRPLSAFLSKARPVAAQESIPVCRCQTLAWLERLN